MARSFSSAKRLPALVDGFLLAINRRSFSAVSSEGVTISVVRGGVGRNGIVKQTEEKVTIKEESETSAWVPDPITGYYRPENRAAEIDVAELREVLLNHKIRQH